MADSIKTKNSLAGKMIWKKESKSKSMTKNGLQTTCIRKSKTKMAISEPHFGPTESEFPVMGTRTYICNI